MRTMRAIMGAVVAVGTTTVGVTARTRAAAEFEVTPDAVDAVDAALGDGQCASASGVCTLRAAVQEANASPGHDTISIPAGTVTLDLTGAGEDDSATGDLDIRESVMIIGDPLAATIVRGDADPDWDDRIFDVPIILADQVTFADLTIVNGHATDGSGGGLRVLNAPLTLGDVVFDHNDALVDGGGVAVGTGGEDTPALAVDGLTATFNTAGQNGGGLFYSAAGTLNDLEMTDNTAGVHGGGLYGVVGDVDGAVVEGNRAAQNGGGILISRATLDHATVEDNVSLQGAGIWAGHSASIRNTEVIGNDAIDSGGGIAVITNTEGETSLVDVLVKGNTAACLGGGLMTTEVDVARTLVDANSVTGVDPDTGEPSPFCSSGLIGGGIWDSGPASFTNVTVTGNLILDVDVRAEEGGGVYSISALSTYTNVTIALNDAAIGAGVRGEGPRFLNTIVAGNVGSANCSPTLPFVSLGYNIDSDGSCGLAETGDQSIVDPLLLPLADNGGPTRTHALGDGSPAIDRGDPNSCPTVDQRGVTRPRDGDADGVSRCDVGAFERVGGRPDAVDDTETTPEDTAVDIDVLGNDTDPDGDPLTVTVATQPANGSAAVNADATIKFTPNADWFGTTSFTYTISDGNGGSDTATVTVTVTAVNDSPTADAGADRATPEGSGVTLLGSGSDVDSTVLAFAWTPAAGLTPSATVAQPTFTPLDNGTTTFTLGVCDDATPQACDATPDTMSVTATNVAPTVTLPSDRTVGVDVSSSVTVLFTDPGADDTHVAVIDWGDGSDDTTIDPATSGFARAHTFTTTGTYTVEGCVTDDDGGVHCDTMTVTVGGAGSPVAVDDEDTTAEDNPVTVLVLSNDVDPDDDPLEITSVTQPELGTVVINDEADPDDDTVTYTPPPNFVGTETFTYTISDGNGGMATATVTVTVTAVNDEPVVVPGADRETVEGSSVEVTGSATDVDGPFPLAFHWEVLDGPDVSEEPSGVFADPDSATTQFTPKQDGVYVLQLEVCDADALCDTDAANDTVEVTVANVTPTVTLPVDRTVDAGVSTSIDVSFTDPGADDTHGAVIDWGDESADTTIDPATSPFTRSHTFTATGTRTVAVCVSDDDGEACETMTIAVVSPIRLSIGNATMTEPDSGTTPMTFTITASPAPSGPVSVVANTVNGTATAPSDYTALPAAGQTVTFAAGQATRTVSVPIVGDLLREADETFTVTMSSPTGATIDDGTAIGRINNDDVCTIIGTAGANTLNGTAGNDVICALGGNDTINGLGGNDTVFGGDGNDRIGGGAGNDTLRGEDGEDVLEGEAGNDVVDGGGGIDRGSWAGAPGPVVVDLTTNVATGWGNDTLATLEEALGGSFDDTLRGNGLANVLIGGDGDDTVLGRSGSDELLGQAGNDVLRGDTGADRLVGGSGNDRLHGGDGDDRLLGLLDGDELSGDAGDDDLDGGDGFDTVSGGIGHDALTGGSGRDQLAGGSGNDEANGGDGNDVVTGNDGHDIVRGNDNDDHVTGGDGNDRLNGGDGVDLVNGNAGDDNAYGGPGNDRSPNGTTAGVHGGTGTNTVNGGTGTDWCSFGPGQTRINCELP